MLMNTLYESIVFVKLKAHCHHVYVELVPLSIVELIIQAKEMHVARCCCGLLNSLTSDKIAQIIDINQTCNFNRLLHAACMPSDG